MTPPLPDPTLDDVRAPGYANPAQTPPADEEPTVGGAGYGWRILLVLLVLSGLGAGGTWGVQTAMRRGWIEQLQRSYSEVSLLPGPLVRPATPETQVRVYYVVRDRALDYRTDRLRRAPANTAERVDLIREAINDPAEQARSPLPAGVAIRGIYLLDGIVWIDLGPEFQQVDRPTPLRERLYVYALVNTFLLNAPDLQGARILIDGRPAHTAWGWLDLGVPLAPNLSLLG